MSQKVRVQRDPVFLFMIVAVVLAVGCSLTLRAMVNAGPKSASAATYEPLEPLPRSAGMPTVPTR